MEKFLSDIPPFKLCEGIYFVGSRAVSVHLFESDAGLILLDTGYPDMFEQILESIRALGFDPKDVKHIFHSHGHIDHFGTTERLVALSGAKTYIGRADNDIVNGKRDLSWAKELGLERLPYFNCDVLIDDGDVFDFGNLRIRARHTPGHTEGVVSYFIERTSDEKSIVAAMHGGAGMNSLSRVFLEEYSLPLSLREDFRRSLHALAKERVDIVLGNHPGQSDTEGKRARLLLGAPHVFDPAEWGRMLALFEAQLDALLWKEQTEL